MRNVTIRDVAGRAGVSINTVSRALTGKRDVSEKTRALVQAVAVSMDYRPNAMAQSLVGKHTRTLGLVVTDCTDHYYANVIRSAEQVASSQGFALLLVNSNESVLKEIQALSLLRERRVDGILLTAVDADAPHVQQILKRDLPIVLVSRRPKRGTYPYVGSDKVAGELLAVRHLVELGHRQIAQLGRTDSPSSAREQLEGWRKAMQKLRTYP